MTVSSKFGLKIGSTEVFELKSPDDALELVRAVVEQFLGNNFTTYQPRCPICDTNLCDHEKHMNKPVGECTNEKCGSTIHAADYFGKVLDVLAEWEKCRPEYEAKLERLINNQKDDDDDDDRVGFGSGGKTGGYTSDEEFIKEINGEPVFIW